MVQKNISFKKLVLPITILLCTILIVLKNCTEDKTTESNPSNVISTFTLNNDTNIVSDGNLTHITQIAGGWQVGNACGVDNYMDAFIVGDYLLNGDLDIGNAKLTIYGSIINNDNYEIFLKCGNSQLIEDQVLGVPEIPEIGKFKIYPNPVSDEFFVTGQGISNIEIHDLNGRKAYSIRTQSQVNRILRGNLPSGVYVIRIFSVNGRVDAKKLIFK